MSKSINCPLCGIAGTLKQVSAGGYYYCCKYCGYWGISHTAEFRFNEAIEDPINRAKIRNFVSHVQPKAGENTYCILFSELERVLNSPLPDIQKQQDNLILYIGKKIQSPGTLIESPDVKEMLGPVGAVDEKAINFIMIYLFEEGLLNGGITQTMGSDRQLINATLSINGWKYYEALKKEQESKRVFMAMQFERADLDDFYNNHLKPAIETLGFELFRVDEKPRPGLIDDTIRISIKASRFLITDLTEQNRGAYWEAGIGEGEGKKVFYTCHERDFNNIHFDTSHHYTIKWSEDTVKEKIRELQSMIIAEFYDEIPKEKIEAFLQEAAQ